MEHKREVVYNERHEYYQAVHKYYIPANHYMKQMSYAVTLRWNGICTGILTDILGEYFLTHRIDREKHDYLSDEEAAHITHLCLAPDRDKQDFYDTMTFFDNMGQGLVELFFDCELNDLECGEWFYVYYHYEGDYEDKDFIFVPSCDKHPADILAFEGDYWKLHDKDVTLDKYIEQCKKWRIASYD